MTRKPIFLCLMGCLLLGLFLIVQAAVNVLPTVETGPAHHAGDNADDSCIWIHPTDPSLSTVIGDDKGGGLMVWNLAGAELQYIEGSILMNNLDLRYNFPLGAQSVALMGVVNENQARLNFYKVNPSTRLLEAAGYIALSKSAPYGGCLYHSPVSGKYYFFVCWKDGVWQQWELNGSSGSVTGTMVRTADAGGQCEGCVADDVLGKFYIGEEAAGVWKYGAEPGDGSTRVQVDNTGGGHLTADVEGLTIYYKSDGTGYLVVSCQGNNTMAVYTQGRQQHLHQRLPRRGERLDRRYHRHGWQRCDQLPARTQLPQRFVRLP